MNQNKKIKIVFFSFLTLTFFVLLAVYVSFWPETREKQTGLEQSFSPEQTAVEVSPPLESQTAPETTSQQVSMPLPTVRMTINETSYDVPIQVENSVYSLMETLRKNGEITFTEKTYSGMGKIITSINGIKSNGGMTWIYYVNDEEAKRGVSQFIIKPGDVVSWKYEKVTY